LDLPLDHFRLLGVSPATDAQTVLRHLQLRLDRPPEQGYTVETLQARAELLRASADLLSDPGRREAYESDLTALAAGTEPLLPALEIPSSREVAGLLLLLEAGQPIEAFQMACRALQPPQAPALGSSREADLTLVAGEAALAAAADQSQDRHYELAARTLQQGLQLLQRMGQLPQLRERIHAELDALTPFRVLDLLSRDPAATQERQEGLALLEQLVQRRGGLEGDRDDGFAQEDFQTFFKQMRTYLTVQEQLDLFQRWGSQGSAAAAFLGTITLTASGFAQRKPERIAAAREQLRNSGREGIEPLLANLDLLLGDVEAATERFHRGASPELRQWAERQSGDPLAQVCAWCRDWLARDVLPGYRDLDADPDLEAYFSDRDVLSWVEREDRRSGRSFANASPSADPPGFQLDASLGPATGSVASGASLGSTPDPFDSFGFGLGESFATGFSDLGAADTDRTDRPAARRSSGGAPLARSQPDRAEPIPLTFPWPRGRSIHLNPRDAAVAAAASLALLLGIGAWLLRPQPRQSPSELESPTPQLAPAPPATPAGSPPAQGAAPPPGADTTGIPRPSSPMTAGTNAAVTGSPLTAADPSAAQLKGLLERWLKAKAMVLAGATPPADLDRLARQGLLSQLEQQRAQDRTRGRVQAIEAEVRSVAILERSPRRIAIQADLGYSDITRDGSGRVIERTAPTSLRNVYVFGRDGDTWRLAATRSAR
jgi:hypothetical protein